MHVDTFSWWHHLFCLNLDICFVAPELLQCCLFTFESVSGRLPINITQEAQLSPIGPRDASCQLKSCQLPHNSAETTYTTSPDQIDGMKLEI